MILFLVLVRELTAVKVVIGVRQEFRRRVATDIRNQNKFVVQ